MVLEEFVDQCARCIRTRDGVGLSQLLRADSKIALAAATESLDRHRDGLIQRGLPSEYDKMVEKLLTARGAVAAQQWYDAFSLHSEAMQALFKEYDNLSNDNWLCQPVTTLCTEHRIIAQEAYEEAMRKKVRVGTLSKAEETIRKFFRKSVQDKSEDPSKTKKYAVLALAVQLFKIHFKLNTLSLCTDVTRLIESMILGVMSFDSFPMAHQIAYSFYVGRLALYDENFLEAERNLSYAYRRTPASAAKNKRQIARFLICTKLNLGVVPAQKMLTRYKLHQFTDIVAAIRSGDIRRFEKGVEEHKWQFINEGTYLAVERLQNLVHRSLARRVFLILQPTKGTRIPLSAYSLVLEQLGINTPEDEMECILANLVFEGMMKGYISHKRRMLVLSNQTAFPKVSSVLNPQH